MRDGQHLVNVFAVRFGPDKYQSVGGGVKTVAVYDYGEQLKAEELAELNRNAAAAAQQAVAKAARDKQISEAKARADKARSDREKQPCPRHQPATKRAWRRKDGQTISDARLPPQSRPATL
jgi:hypothetical protein